MEINATTKCIIIKKTHHHTHEIIIIKNQLPDQPQQKNKIIQNNIYMIYIYFYMYNKVYRLSYDCDMQYISYKKIYMM